VDLLIGDSLIVEIDSETHHGKPEARRRDLQRDAVAAALDFETLRFDYTSVMFDWPFVTAMVESVVARDGHVRSARSVIRGARRA
jgi:very-short-patch-repair endonuclease